MSKLFVFNPDCEMAIANGDKFYMCPSNIQRMIKDLALLPAYLADADDAVWVENSRAARHFENGLQRACKYVDDEALKVGDRTWRGEPWGLSPKICHWMAEKNLGEEWKASWKEWFSRKTAQRGLGYLLSKGLVEEEEIIPHVFSSLEELKNIVKTGRWIVKAPWSSSGKGLLRLENGLQKKEKEWIGGILKRQGYMMLEKHLTKVMDFAMEYYLKPEKVDFLGWSAFDTGEHGEYISNLVDSQENIEKKIALLTGSEKLEALKLEMPKMLKYVLPDYKGHLGIDMMVYRNEQGMLQIQPCVEINLRYNMGIVALHLYSKYMQLGRSGSFNISFDSRKGEALERWKRLQQEERVEIQDGRLATGCIPLTPITEETQFTAWLRTKK